MTIIFLWVAFGLALQNNAEAPSSLPLLSESLLQKYETHSRFHLVKDDVEKLSANIRKKHENAAEQLKMSTEKLDNLFKSRVEALKKLTEAAEASANVFDTYDDRAYAVPQDEERCQKYMKAINISDVHYESNSAEDLSAVHINIESYHCDPLVMRDFDWTGSEFVEKTMKENKRLSPSIGHQFIGTYSGLTRMYPRRKWEVAPSPITIDLFDPRFRPWFVNAETLPKDIVFLIDYSGSVKGPTMHLMKIAMMYILSTLSPNDYFFGVYYNSKFDPILACNNRTFMPATTNNKKIFFEKLGEIEEKDQGLFSQPFNFSLDVLRGNLDSDQSLFSDYRSNGHKLLIFFTDGVDEWPSKLIDEQFQTRNNDLIRIFGYSMGYGVKQLPLPQFLACKTNGGHSLIDSIMDVKPQSRTFLDALGKVQGLLLKDVPAVKRDPSWTRLYMETQGLGPTVSISLPVLSNDDVVWHGKTLAGIAGIDISLAELTSPLPLQSEKMYAFIVDNNGVLIYHPHLKIPKTEVYSIRRSACYDSSHVKSKSGSVLRVHYGFSDERVHRLIGLLDSIPTIDMYDLEGNDTTVRDLRRRIVTKTCIEEPLTFENKEYYCSHLSNSPFTLVLVNDITANTMVYGERTEALKIPTNPLLGYLYPRRETCGWKLDRFPLADRFTAFSSLSESDCPDDLRMSRAMTNAMYTWARSWPTSDKVNESCALTPTPDGFDPQYFINSFVHTRANVAAFYPSCSEQWMKEVINKFEMEKLSGGDESLLHFTVRSSNVFAYKTIGGDTRLAVVGAQWRWDYLDSVLDSWIATNPDWAMCLKSDCLLVTRSGHVVASSMKHRMSHLSTFDPHLYETLHKSKLVSIEEKTDVQAECRARLVAPWSSASPSSHSILHYVVRSFFKLFKSSFWIGIFDSLVHLTTAQPSMRGGICRFSKIKPFERCHLKHYYHRLMLNVSKRQMQLTGFSTCSRYANVFTVPQTTLTLIVVDPSCPIYKPRKLFRSEPKKLEGCTVMHSYSRRPPYDSMNVVAQGEEFDSDCDTNE